jgi:hypothetical protein
LEKFQRHSRCPEEAAIIKFQIFPRRYPLCVCLRTSAADLLSLGGVMDGPADLGPRDIIVVLFFTSVQQIDLQVGIKLEIVVTG